MNTETKIRATLAARASTVAVLMTIVAVDARPQSVQPRLMPDAESGRSTVVADVSDSKALGYVGNRKFLIDAQGMAYCAVRTRGPQGYPTVCLLRSVERWPDTDRFDSVWLEDRPGCEVSTAPQRHPTIAATGDGNVHIVWYGGTGLEPAHQIRYARFTTAGDLRLAEEIEPFSVAGFEQVYAGPLTGDELWQEHPCIAAGSDGLIYLAWEARDPSRLNKLGAPQPGISWAVRAADGSWSVSGPVGTPPYAQVDGRFPSQSRPTLVAGASGEMHIVCYGSVGGTQQILHGVLRDRAFSGWSVVSPSPGDQRQVSAACDPSGRLHVAWREGTAGVGAAPASVAIEYASIDPLGKVAGPLRISPVGENASTPSITADGGAVSIAWVAWAPGAVNSEGKRDNGFPSDNSLVEGKLEICSRTSGSASFGAVVPLDAGPASYPTWASRSIADGSPEALLWTRAKPGNKHQLRLGRVTPR